MAKQLMQVVSVTISAAAGKPKVEKIGTPMPVGRALAMRDKLNEQEVGKDLDLDCIVAFDAVKVEALPTLLARMA